jgi:aspartyl-tRNA(Asn)/glutamyl-tRNA(Gln) amidotransferase subunit A
MPDLTTDHVAALASAAGLPVSPDDLVEVTHRLNAFIEALAPLADGDLGVEPTPFSVAPIPFADGGPAATLATDRDAGSATSGRGRRDATPDTPERRAAAPEGRAAAPGGRAAAPGDLAFLGAARLAALVRDKQVSPVELTRLYLDRIDRLDGRLRAYITVCRDEALDAANRAEAAVMRGETLGPLHGVPVGVKDQFDTAGVRTTMGSRVFADRVPTEDAGVITALRRGGAVLLGKHNLTEFAMGGTFAPPFGQPRNPWNVEHDPGSSSSGSGVATAAALCAAAVGEDTGGSVRTPASWCGVVGLRPTWGLVSRRGSFPLAWSMDTPGPITQTVEDTALVLSVIAGHDPGDPLSSPRPVPDYRAALTGEVRGLRVGVVRELTSSRDTRDDVRQAVLEAVRVLERLGASVDEVSLPLATLGGAVFMALADSDGAGVHARLIRARAADYDRSTRRRLLTAALLPSGLYHVAARARAVMRRDVLAALARHDVLVAPSGHRAAATIAESTAAITSREDAAGRYFTRRSYGAPASLGGVPATAVPCGFTADGLPLSLQIIGRAFGESTVLRAAHAYEQATAWHDRRPPLDAV